MDRRDAIKALGGLAAGTGMTVTPVTTHEATDCVLVLLKLKGFVSAEQAIRIKDAWTQATADTPLADVKVAVFDDNLSVEFVREIASRWPRPSAEQRLRLEK